MCLLISSFPFLMFSSSQVEEVEQCSGIALFVLIMWYGRPWKIPSLAKIWVF